MRKSSVNRRTEATSSRSQPAADDSRRMMPAVTNADFPRVLNGPAPGYAEDALERLLLEKHVVGGTEGVLGERDSTSSSFVRRVKDAPESAAAAADVAQEAADKPPDWRGARRNGCGIDGAVGLEPTLSARVSELEGHFGAALSEGVWSDNEDRGQQHEQVTW